MLQPENQRQLRKRNKTNPDASSQESLDPEVTLIDGEEDSSQATQVTKETQTEKEYPVVKMEDFEAVDINDKLNLLMAAINKINTGFHYKFEELSRRIDEDMTSHMEKYESLQQEITARIDDLGNNLPQNATLLKCIEDLEAENSMLQDDVTVIKGLLQVQDKQISGNKEKIVDLTACSMANNVVISGLLETEKEECKQLVLEFLREQMKMEVEDSEVLVAHRLGCKAAAGSKPRQMVVRCVHSLRECIFNSTKNLKDVKNAKGDYYYVDKQLPEPLFTQRRERNLKIKEVRDHNKQETDTTKHKTVVIHNNTLFINKIPQKQYVSPPTVADIFNVTKEDSNKMEKMKFQESVVHTKKGSTFRGFAIPVKGCNEVRLAYKKLKILYPESDHMVMAYSVKTYTGHQDNGEYGASRRLLDILTTGKRKNVAIFIARECTWGRGDLFT